MRIPLNPCDYHFYALQRTATDAMTCRFKAAMGFDVSGAVSGEALQQAMHTVLRTIPVLGGRLQFSTLLARPAWEIGEPSSIQDVYRFEDADGADEGDVAANAAMERAASGAIDLSRPPIVQLHHIRARAFDRVLLTWPHPLMDGEGGYAVLRRLNEALGHGAAIRAPAVSDHPVSSPAGSFFARQIRAVRGFRDQRRISRIQTTQPPSGPVDASGRVRLIRRLGTEGDFNVITAAAKRLAPPGPGLYARHLAACTIRALRRLYDSHGWSTPEYAVSFPMRPGGAAVGELPLGNYLVAAALHVPHADALNWARLGDVIAEQVSTFSREGHDLDQWALLCASARFRPGQYHAAMKSSVAKTPLISGYSYFQAEDATPLEHFAGHSILRDLFGGVVTIPPGWNPAFWRHGRRITLTMAWPVGYFADALAKEYVDLIVAEALGET